jgi:L,D-transpeptidase YcbB
VTRILLPVLAAGVLWAGCADASGGDRSSAGANDSAGASVSVDDLSASLAAGLDALGPATRDSLYGERAEALWVDPSGLTGVGRAALDELERAGAEGLSPRRYRIEDLRRLATTGSATAEHLARLDIGITRGLATMARDMAAGLAPSTSFDPGWQLDSLDHARAPARLPDARAILDEVARVRPRVQQYALLGDVLGALRERSRSGGWQRLSVTDRVFAAGDSAAVVAQLRTRLEQSLDPEERRLAREGRQRPERFDDALAESLARFQARHDVEQDGRLGPATAAALNTPVDVRIAEVELALERWRWLPARLGSPAVLVNTPGRRVYVFQDGVPRISMKAIIGSRDWRTALFQDAMEHVVVNPYWNIPGGILGREVLPRALADSTHLRRNNLEIVALGTDDVVAADSVAWEEVVLDTVMAAGAPGTDSTAIDSVIVRGFPFRIRQRPGRENPLGTVKFMFPNRFDIYLHDTPADHLFDERLRTFSHGCVRVERPFELAHFLLEQASAHPPARFDSLEASGERHVLELDEPVPTYLIYQTVWVDDRGVPTFTPDVYLRNDAALAALESAGDEPGGRGNPS